MDIKELMERVRLTNEDMFYVGMGVTKGGGDYADIMEVIKASAEAQRNKFLNDPNLALVIREGDEVPLGVDIETHPVVLLKKALKEANND